LSNLVFAPEIDVWIRATIEWVQSPEGQDALEEDEANARKFAKEFTARRAVDPKVLHRPTTI